MKCTNCKLNKEREDFADHPKHGKNLWCKQCINTHIKALRKARKESNYLLWKAEQLRSNWIRRGKQYGITPAEIPVVQDILSWLLKQQPFTCYYTGESLSEKSFGVDHKISIFRGGNFSLDNLAVTNLKINGAKGDLSEQEFKELLNTISHWEDQGVRLLRRLNWSNSMFKGGNN